jgi:glycosyltransferase involved in cell wall biosynthesis
MKVLLANKFFYDHGGPETVLFATRDLLAARGHDVIDFAMQDARNRPSPYAAYFPPNMDLQSVRPTLSSAKTALRFLDSHIAAKEMRRLVHDTRPDVAHLHSINHQLTPSIIRVLRDERVPVVMTLHDYKLVCPAYTMLAGDRICEACSGGRFYRATTTRCRGAARSALLTAESYLQHRILRSYRGVSLFLSPSGFLASKFAAMGFRHPIELLPNPAPPIPADEPQPARGEHFLFVGRAAPEKGIATLCRAAVAANVHVRIAGDGPELDSLTREFGASANVDFLGRVEPTRAQALMRESLAVVVPSEWYENQSMVILEALGRGTPVIASNIGGNPELVVDGETGLTHTPGDVAHLAAKLAWARDHRDEMQRMGETARDRMSDFSLDRYYERLTAVYDRVRGHVPPPSAAPEAVTEATR